jgi:hypothetical protein
MSRKECGMSDCDREASIMRRRRPTRGCRVIGKKNSYVVTFSFARSTPENGDRFCPRNVLRYISRQMIKKKSTLFVSPHYYFVPYFFLIKYLYIKNEILRLNPVTIKSVSNVLSVSRKEQFSFYKIQHSRQTQICF